MDNRVYKAIEEYGRQWSVVVCSWCTQRIGRKHCTRKHPMRDEARFGVATYEIAGEPTHTHVETASISTRLSVVLFYQLVTLVPILQLPKA